MPDDSREFNGQPDWLNSPQLILDSMNVASMDSTQGFLHIDLGRPMPLLGPIGLGSFSINVGQEHCPIHNVIEEFISFDFNERTEKYCLRCIRDLLRERLIPLGEEYVSPPIQENPPVLKSRYDLLREKNGTEI